MNRRTIGSIAATLLGLLVLGVFLLANFINPGTPTPFPEPTSVAGPWYQLYFSDPERTANLSNPSGGIPAAISASFAEAQQTLDVAVYDLDYPPYAEALIAAHQRGVRVRLVMDTDYLNEPPVQAVRDAGIPVVDDRRDAFMHNKFAVIDGARVWTGSANFTFTDAYRNNNNMILITSPRLAQNYTAEFEQMFTNQDFGRAVTPPNPSLTVSGVLIENRFSPNAGVASALLDVLKTARSSIHFMAFAFTREDFAATLIDRALAGVTVQGVFERRQIEAGADGAWRALSRAGLDVRQDGNTYLLHHKVFIVDQQIVVLGSYNFSRNAEEQNDENVLIIHDATIAAAYYAEWQKVWALAQK
jgi:phosphatidylserine/phosphatidylglycerophosphate/cardiolipin synthase-like enzyme